MLALVLAVCLVPLVHAADSIYTYPVKGGDLEFDPATGMITRSRGDVYEAAIPSEIHGVPVVGIGRLAFNAVDVKKVVISDGVKIIEDSAFNNQRQLTSITIPDSVESIGSYAFSSCGLKTIKLPANLKTVEYRTFSDSISLEEVILPDGLDTIGRNAFANCMSLSSLTIGPNLKFINGEAFYGCNSLKEIYFQGDAPIAIGDIFGKSGIDGLVVYYPEGASGWSSPTWEGATTKPYRKTGTAAPTAPTTPAVGGFTDVAATSLPCTRAAAVQFMWKATGSPIPVQTANFSDVAADTDYAQAVAWAVENGITNGTSATEFSPSQTCTRGQIVTFLHRGK